MLTRPLAGVPFCDAAVSRLRPLSHRLVTLPPIPSSSTPAVPPLTSAVAPSTPPAPVAFPIGWLLEHAAAPIQYRALTEVAKLPASVTDPLSFLPLTHRPALVLASIQAPDGTWNRSMLTVPSARGEQHFDGVGTISAVRRLLEYGWNKDTPPLVRARRTLFRLLAEDDSPDFLFELGVHGVEDEDMARRGRAILREAAAATLAQAGYEDDPRIRGAAKRIVERVAGFLRSPLAQKPFVRVGNQHVLAPEAAPPSIHALLMLAYMPLFRTENHEAMHLIGQYLAQPLPRQEAVQLCGKKVVPQPHLMLGDPLPNRNVADADVPSALMWLELMGRLGFLRRNENWCKLLDRFLDDRDDNGVWHPHKGTTFQRSANPVTWPYYPLEGGQSGDERYTDVTFRLGLIARLAGRPIELV